MAIITSFINWKGGVGKTTLTYHVAIGLEQLGKKVLVIDLDPQCNLSFLAGGHVTYIEKVYREGTLTIKDLFEAFFSDRTLTASDLIQKQTVRSSPDETYKHVDLVFCHEDLTPVDLDYFGADALEKVSVIKRFLNQVADEYDHVLFDCPPSVTLVTQNAFFASDSYVIPALPEYLSTVGISRIRNKMNEFNRTFASLCEEAALWDYTETTFSGVIMNKVEEYGGAPKSAHRGFFNLMQKEFVLFDNYLNDGPGIALAAENHLPVYAYEHFARGNQSAQRQALYLENITQEFLRRVCKEAHV